MTVRELIKELENCQNKNAQVFLYIPEGSDTEVPLEISLVDDCFDGTRVDINSVLYK